MLPPEKPKPAHFSWPPWLAFMLSSSITFAVAVVVELWRAGAFQ